MSDEPVRMSVKWTGGTKEEYETQFFGFGCQTMQLSLRRLVESSVISTIKNMDRHLQDTLELNSTDKEIVTKSCDKFSSLILQRSNDSFQALDAEVEKVFTIPENVLLPSDEDQRQVTEDEFNEIKSEVESLKLRAKRAALMKKLLSSELEELESLDKQCELANKTMQIVDSWTKKIDEVSSNCHLNSVNDLCSTLPYMQNKCDLDVLF